MNKTNKNINLEEQQKQNSIKQHTAQCNLGKTRVAWEDGAGLN